MNWIYCWLVIGGMSLLLLGTMMLLCLIWGMHFFTYPSKKDKNSSIQVRKPVNYGGFWKVAKEGCIMYGAVSGRPLKKNNEICLPLRGMLFGGRNALIIMMVILMVMIFFTFVNPEWFFALIVLYFIILFFTVAIVLPDHFVKYSNLVGRFWGCLSSADAPKTAMLWGAATSVYTISLMLRLTTGVDVVSKIATNTVWVGGSVFGIPVVLALTKLAFDAVMLSQFGLRLETWTLHTIFPAGIGILYCWFIGGIILVLEY